MGDATELERDSFGNPIDPGVGYARGRILADSCDEMARAAHARELARDRLLVHGVDSLFDFTGSPCDFPLWRRDNGLALREFSGTARFAAELTRAGLQHMGGGDEQAVAVFNRTSAGIVAALLALTQPREAVISVTPGKPSHPSIRRAAALAQNTLVEVSGSQNTRAAIAGTRGRVVVITAVSSELATMPPGEFEDVITAAKQAGRIALVDDAYGARVRPLLLDQPAAIPAGADLAITSVQKAGLGGPRAGLLAGEARLVLSAATRASELGLEARAPLALAVLRALQRFEPIMLHGEVRAGERLHAEISSLFGPDRVTRTLLGPVVSEDDVLFAAVERAGGQPRTGIVPAEAGAALGTLLLKNHGVVTVNAVGMPGARASLRLKSTEQELDRFGGESAIGFAVDDSLARLGELLKDSAALSALLLGLAANRRQ
jgi:L-seryl-tRNA(Ser) seleniumtransferase